MIKEYEQNKAYSENGVCQSKKVATMGHGYVGLSEYLFCSPCKDESENGGKQE